ncbi:MAG: hypothetical protein V4706_02920 [Pseudomonadota bacterium]
MACSTCTSIRRAVNNGLLRPFGLPQLPLPPANQAGQQPTPTVQRPNPAWPTRK